MAEIGLLLFAAGWEWLRCRLRRRAFRSGRSG